jgi:hypothetical protein
MITQEMLKRLDKALGVSYKTVYLAETRYNNLIKWIDVGPRHQSKAYAFKAQTIPNKKVLIHNPVFFDIDRSWLNLVILNTSDQQLYFYSDLKYKLNEHWINYTVFDTDERKDNTYYIVGEYKTMPLSYFKSSEQLEKYCELQYKRLNAKYKELVEGLNDQVENYWREYELSRKVSSVNKQIRKMQADFK